MKQNGGIDLGVGLSRFDSVVDNLTVNTGPLATRDKTDSETGQLKQLALTGPKNNDTVSNSLFVRLGRVDGFPHLNVAIAARSSASTLVTSTAGS